MAHSLGMSIQTDISMQIPILKGKIKLNCFLNSNEVENTVDGIIIVILLMIIVQIMRMRHLNPM